MTMTMTMTCTDWAAFFLTEAARLRELGATLVIRAPRERCPGAAGVLSVRLGVTALRRTDADSVAPLALPEPEALEVVRILADMARRIYAEALRAADEAFAADMRAQARAEAREEARARGVHFSQLAAVLRANRVAVPADKDLATWAKARGSSIVEGVTIAHEDGRSVITCAGRDGQPMTIDPRRAADKAVMASALRAAMEDPTADLPGLIEAEAESRATAKGGRT